MASASCLAESRWVWVGGSGSSGLGRRVWVVEREVVVNHDAADRLG